MNRLSACLRASVVMSLLLSGCSTNTPDSQTSLKIGVGGQAQFVYLPLTLADQLGYFKDEGLTAEISDLRGGSEALAALMGGSVDVVAGFYEHTIRAQAQGKHLVMVTLFDVYPGLVLMVSTKHVDAVRSIKDLVDHPVGVTAPGSTTDAMVKYLLRQHGLDPQAIPVVTTGTTTMVAAIQQDRVWAGVMVDPLASKLEKDGIAKPLYDTRTAEGTRQVFGGSWPAGGFYTTAEFVASRPGIVQAVVNAGVKALKYVQSHPAEGIASRMPEYFLAGDPDLYIRSLRANLSMFSPDGRMPVDGPDNVLRTLMLVNASISADKIDLKRTYDNSFVEQISPRRRADTER